MRRTTLVKLRYLLSTLSDWRVGLPHVVTVVTLIATLAGCKEKAKEVAAPPPATHSHKLLIIYPPEVKNLLGAAIERINARQIRLKDGSALVAHGSSFDDLSKVRDMITDDSITTLWVAPLQSFASATKASSPGAWSVTECSSIMSSRLGVAYRGVDSFALHSTDSGINLADLVSYSDQASTDRAHLMAGSPRFTSSGLLSGLSLLAVGANRSIATLTPELLDGDLAKFRAAQRNMRSYFISDYEALGWLSKKIGGEPIALLTTEQNFLLHRQFSSDTTLKWTRFSQAGLTLDYPICTINTSSTSETDIEANQAVRLFLSGDEFKSLTASAGFSPPLANDDTRSNKTGETALNLINHWPAIRRPAVTIFVIDASIKSDRAKVETIRREIKSFIQNKQAKDDLVGVVSASSFPEIIGEPSTETSALKGALDRLTTSGGNAIRDGVQTAFNLISDISYRDYRRAIVVFTSNMDTSSETPVSLFTNRASQLVGRKDVALFVFGLNVNEATFAELPQTVRQVGGVFVASDLSTLPGNFLPVARQLQ